ncbi:MAG: DUF1800 family protein [Cytophagales bacterium]|nr:MAG: DUF1800 family protein [Cytophagales bacterium]
MAALDPISGALGVKRAAHLLRRTTFGATKEQIDQFAAKTIGQAITDLFQAVTDPPLPKDPKTSATWLPLAGTNNSTEGELKGVFLSWWNAQMYHSGMNIREKMTYFLHTHFTTIQSRVDHSAGLYYQIALYRKYALGDFKELAKKVCLDNAMILNLDCHLNEKGLPQENYAREFLELYTIGKGIQIADGNYTNYTETDIREAAKVLSGYDYDNQYNNIDPDTNFPRAKIKAANQNLTTTASRHDAGVKRFTAAFQSRTIQPPTNMVSGGLATIEGVYDELNQLVNMIFDQQETAKYICRKLYRFFVYYKITDYIENNVIVPLANTFRSNNYQLQPVLQQLLQSQHFFDEDTNLQSEDDKLGAIIKSPLELVISAMRFFKVTMPNPDTQPTEYHTGAFQNFQEFFQQQGMNFYEPFDVAGYEAYHQVPNYHRNWISSNYLGQRYKFGERLLKGQNASGATANFKLDVIEFFKTNPKIATDPQGMVNELLEYLLPFANMTVAPPGSYPQNIPSERTDDFYTLLRDAGTFTDWITDWNAAVASNNYAAVKIRLENLVKGILQSPEFQLQ